MSSQWLFRLSTSILAIVIWGVALTEFPSAGVITFVQGLIFYAFGYGLVASLARGRLAITKRETSTSIKTLFAIAIGVILAFGAQRANETQPKLVSSFIYDGEVLDKK